MVNVLLQQRGLKCPIIGRNHKLMLCVVIFLYITIMIFLNVHLIYYYL